MSEYAADAEALAEWLGEQAESYNVTDLCDEQTTWINAEVDDLAARLLASDWMRQHDADVRAEAWDEGFTRGFYDPLAGGDRDASESSAENPYDQAARLRAGGDA